MIVGPAGLLSLFVVLHSGLLLGFRLLIRVEVPSLLRFRGSGRSYDYRLRFMSRADSDGLTCSLLDDDVSSAWAVWSSAAETALADAYCFSGGPVVVVLLVFVLFALVVPRFVRFVVALLIPLMVGIIICIVILPLLLSWILGDA